MALAITAHKMASRKLSVSEVLALLHPNEEDILDDIQEPVQDGNDKEFDYSEDDFCAEGSADSSVENDEDSDGEEIDANSGEEETVDDSDQHSTEGFRNCDILQELSEGMFFIAYKIKIRIFFNR